MSDRVLRYEVATRETLERIAREPLPGISRDGGSTRESFRDVFYDTADEDLRRRGAWVAIRYREDGGRVLEVRAAGAPGEGAEGGEEAADAAAEGVRHLWAAFTSGEPGEIFAGLSDPARLLRALVDPARLEPRLEMETDRLLRHAADAAGRPVVLACDTVVLRAGETLDALHEVEVRLPPPHDPAGAAAPEEEPAAGEAAAGEAALLRELVEGYGVRPTLAAPLDRARERMAQRELDTLESAVRTAVSVAVVLLDDERRVALRRQGGVLAVPAGSGRGEDAARRVVRGCLGHSAGRFRLLGRTPGSASRPALEVWLAEELPPAGTECGEALVWVELEELYASVGSPALRDGPTLAALQVAARAALTAEAAAEGWRPGTSSLREAAATLLAGAAATGGEQPLPPGSLLNMELSVLAFNRRVLALAEEDATPLFERLRFLSIFCANLDEFFRVRVAGFKRQVAAGTRKRTIDGVTAHEQLDAVGVRARRLMDRAYALLFDTLLPALANHGVRLLRLDEVTEEEGEWLAAYYRERVHPVLTPLAAGPGHPFPHIRNLRPAVGAVVREPLSGLQHFVVVELPGGMPRFVPLPGGKRLVPVEEVIRGHLHELYPGMEPAEAYTFRVTRSAELMIDRAHVSDLLQAVEEEVRRRPFRPVVRLEVQREMPEEMRAFLLRELRYEEPGLPGALGDDDVYPVEWLVDLRGLRELAALPAEPGLHYPPFEARSPVDVARPLFDVLREGEVLVNFPFDSFEATVERFLLEAADDPAVVAIKLALYRTDRSSRIVEALRRASARGKQVVALVELTARFDEQSNIEWARYLRAAGIHVIYGLPGLKCHAKVALVVRREEDGVRRYQYVGTGNLNAATATAYTDLGLLSADPELGEDLNGLFNVLTGYAAVPEYRRVLAAPHNMRRRFVEMIEREAAHARDGRGGHIRAKFNGLADREMIAALYAASRAGVRIELIVRGLCSLRPGVPGLSENIRVFSILGRFLEHARIFRFENAGEPEWYIGSADWRTRNLSHRVEVAAPVRDPAHRARLDEILDEQMARPDAWELGSDGTYYRRPEVAPHALERPAGESGRLLFTTGDG